MKKFSRFAIVILLALSLGGCSWFSKTSDQVKNTDWDSICTWYGRAMSGLDGALTLAEMIDQKDAPFMEAVVRPCIAAAKSVGNNFCASVQSYKAGSLSAADLAAKAKEVEWAYKVAAEAVAKATKGDEVSAVPQ